MSLLLSMHTLWLLVALLYITAPAAHVTPRLDKPTCTARTAWSSATGSNPVIQVDSWGPDSIRIRVALDDILVTPPIQALQPFPPQLTGECSVSPTQSSLTNGNIHADVDSGGRIKVVRISDGVTLLSSSAPSFTPFTPSSVFPSAYSLYSTTVSYTHADGKISGLGEHRVDSYEPRFRHLFEESQSYGIAYGGDIMIPFYTSSAGFGLIFNHAGYGYVDISSTNATWIANATHQLDLWITTTPATHNAQSSSATVYPPLLSNFAQVVGHPNVLPSFASGFWQSKDRYRSESEVLNITAQFAQRNTPVAIFVIDWRHWPYEGSWDFTPLCWPDPAAMVKTVSSYGFRTMISVWPTVDPLSDHFPAMNASGYLTRGADGQSLVGQGNSNYVYDAFNPDARDFVWNALVKGYVSRGIKMFWLDNDEPDGASPGLQYFYGRSDREVGMAWVVQHQQMIFDGLIQSGVPQSEIIMLSRSAWIGTANNNAVIWSGDTNSDWTTFAQQIKVAQQSAMSGIYWWTTDVAGYWGGDLTDDSFQQLLVRWFQFGVFCPIFRTHGHHFPESTTECGLSGATNEFWSFTYASRIEKLIFLRESIRPYVETHLRIASTNGTPLLRPMYYDFNDPMCVTADDQYMFGDAYLVAPVYQYNATWRTVYLPAQHTWTHYFTKTTYDGGQTVNVTTTLDDFPLFTRSSPTQHLF